MIKHPFVKKGKELDSKKIIKELVKSKINDLEDNRTRNFKKEIQNLENESILPELILKNDKPLVKQTKKNSSKFNEYSESSEADLRTFEYSTNNLKGKEGGELSEDQKVSKNLNFGSEYFDYLDPLSSEMNINPVNFHSNISKYGSKNVSGKSEESRATPSTTKASTQKSSTRGL